MKKTILCHAAQIATPMGTTSKHGKEMNEIHVIEDGAVYMEDDVIKAVGSTKEIMEQLNDHNNKAEYEVIDASGCAVIPGFVDSHTHFIFGGYRPEEFFQRIEGASYLDILQNGGGIQNTVAATRMASKNELYSLGSERLKDMLSMGVTTVEGKSGYGLDFDCELKQLEVLKELNRNQPVDIISTYLGAHAVPVEYKNHPEDYIEFMLDKVLPEVKRRDLADFADVFCEEGVFTIEQSRDLLTQAQNMGFNVKMHADEMISFGGGELAADINAASADHLLMVSDHGISKLSKKETVTTLLPLTAFCLNKPFARARQMIDAGCAVALASDYNPGSCFTNSIPLLLALAVIHMGMTMEEALCAMTLNGAAALKLSNQTGSIEVSKKADMILLEYPDYHFLTYHTGKNIVKSVIKNGSVIYNK